MNGSKLRKIVMCVLPVVAAIVAAMPGTVQIIQEGEYATCSYMLAVPVGLAGICAPIAAILNYFTFGCVVFGLISKKKGGFKAAIGVAFVSSLVAVLPLFMRNETTIVIPHVLFPIVTLVEAGFLSYHLKAEKKDEETGKRLEMHEV